MADTRSLSDTHTVGHLALGKAGLPVHLGQSVRASRRGSGDGSGNGTTQTGYLPYEDDRMLAVNLSEAMPLAKDTEITDPTILSQL